MSSIDLERVRELRSVVRWAADPQAFGLLRGISDARWAVAEAPGGGLAGMVGAVPFGRIGVLCHLAVHDGYRGMGLGAGLTRWAVAYLRSRGAGLIRLYSTLQAERLYRSAGFEPVCRRTVYRLDRTPGERARGRAWGYEVSILTGSDLRELCGVDLWCYGADRSALIQATLDLHPGEGLVARDSTGRIRGYLLQSASPGGTRVGPFMASDTTAARLLLTNALASGDAPFEATVTGDGGPAHGLLRELGFTGRPDRLRMELGEVRDGHQPGLLQYATTPYLAT